MASCSAFSNNTFWRQTAKEIVSPVWGQQSSWYFWGSALMASAIWLEDDNKSGDHGLLNYRKIAQDKALGDFSDIGEIYGKLVPNALFFVGAFSYSWWAKDQDFKNDAFLMLKSSVIAMSYTYVLKYIIQAKRPNGELYSFPSGHSTAAFAFASVIGARYPWYYSVPAYSLAVLAALSRLEAEEHHLQDVIMGAGIGIATGLGVYHSSYHTDKGSVKIIPTFNGFIVSAQF